MTSIKHISFSPSQIPDIPISPTSLPKSEAPSISIERAARSSDPNYRFGGIFSSADVDFLVNLVLSGDWVDVEFYIQFLISHYVQFLNRDNTLTQNIVGKLYELLVKVKSQKFYEALEFNDNDTAILILTKEIPSISQHLPPFHFKHLQSMFNDRAAFVEHKLNMAREIGMYSGAGDSCVKYRNTVATEVREQLTELLNMYGSMSTSDAKKGRSSQGITKRFVPISTDEARGWKRKVASVSSACEPELDAPPMSFSPHPCNMDYVEEEEAPIVKKRKIRSPRSTFSEVVAESPTAKLGNMDVLLEAFDIMDHDKPKKKGTSTGQVFRDQSKAVRHKQPKLDAQVEQKITDSLDFQSIKPSKTIKPVRKLCTGGITSTPAIRERMIKVLEQYKTPVTWETIQHKVSGNRAKVWATLCMFVNEGIVLQTGKGRRGHPYKYIMKSGVTIDSVVQGEMESKFKKLDHEAMKLHKQYREKQQEEMQHQRQQEFVQLQQQQAAQPVLRQESPAPLGFTPQQHPDLARLISPPRPYSVSFQPSFRPYTFDTNVSGNVGPSTRPTMSPAH